MSTSTSRSPSAPEALTTLGTQPRTASSSTRRTVALLATAGVLVSTAMVVGSGAPSAILSEDFSRGDGVFVDDDDFWSSGDRGRAANDDWLAESGELQLDGSTGRSTSESFRMWTRRSDLAFVTAAMDLRFHGWTGGSEDWHGINLWMNRTLCTPVPDCTAVDDDGGNSGYALDFLNRDGDVTILKKVAGDTRDQWPQAQTGYTQGGTYYELARATWEPAAGMSYRFAGRVVDNDDGTSTLQIVVDDDVVLEVVDDGTVGGPRLEGGRIGLRSDRTSFTVDNLIVER